MSDENTTEAGLVECDANMRWAMRGQIRTMDLLAISGGRVFATPTGLMLPVGHGYKVQIDLEAGDTYRVRRVFVRDFRFWVKGEVSGVYAEQLSQAAYEASCYVNVAFGDHDPMSS
jgi:hypothetical protein